MRLKKLAQDRRFVLTLIWLAFFVLVIFSIEMYYWGYQHHKINPEEGERFDAYWPVSVTYFAYFGCIIAAWYKKPFKKLAGDNLNETARFVLAVLTTTLFNLLVLYFVSSAHWSNVYAIPAIHHAMKLAGIFSILVAPVNFYYFGVRLPGENP